MAKKIDKIDIFNGGNTIKVTNIRRSTPEEMEEKRKKSTGISAADFIEKETVSIITNNEELTNAILKDRRMLSNEINNALDKNEVYSKAKTPKTPKSLLKYQKTNDKKDMKQINIDLKEHGVTLSAGQVLYHGGLSNVKIGDIIDCNQTLSTTLNVHVAVSNALHNSKAFKEGEVNLNYITVEDDNVDAFIFGSKTKMAHEKEVLLEKDIQIIVKERTKIREMEVTNGEGNSKTVPVNLTKITIKKKLSN